MPGPRVGLIVFGRSLFIALLLICPLRAPGAAPVLSIQRTQEFGWHRILGTADAAQVYTILGSTNLANWNAVATLLDRPGTNPGPAWFSFLDPASAVFPQRFYHLVTQAPGPTNDWKNQVYFPGDPFADTNVIPGNPRPIKFAIDLQEPFRVYYQSATAYPFHYDFAVERLDRFRGMDRAEFDAVSLHTNNQQIVLGAVLLPPTSYGWGVGIQFVGLDVYPPETIRDWFRLVRSTIMDVPMADEVLYMPTLEQTAAAEAARAYFASNQIQVSSPDIWVQGGSQVYATGWALGRLKFFRALDIRAAFNEGRLLPQDILVTDGVPAEIPLVAGVITLVPATPNSHVAILARSYGIPMVYIADPVERDRVRSLADHEVVLRVRSMGYGSPVKVVDVEGSLTPEIRAELLALKAPPALTVTPMAPLGAFSASTTNLTPADIRYFGGKAANFGVLRRVLPTNSPDAIAFSFDLWNAFLDQALPGGRTLRAEINQRLSGYSFPPGLTTLRTNLAAVRDLIRQTAQFTPALQQVITNALARFDAGRKIRFRSSTNLEDTEKFMGAGLYDSYSGCLADDLDGDSTGPSACDPTETGERGVFRAIQRVYASFYNDDAFIERLRFGVNEADVGMAVLVHYSFPDTIEMANGVATLDVALRGVWHVLLTTQVGAESVTNPDGTSLPEVVQIDYYSAFGPYLSRLQGSTRVPSGQCVLNWDSEYRQLMDMLALVAKAYAAQFTNKLVFQLDVEYKKVQPGVLELKQVREIPPPPSTILPAAYLINEPADFVVRQGECSSVFELHYLKSRLHLETLNTRLDRTNTTFLSNVSFEFLDGTNIVTTTGPLTNWPGFSHQADSSGTVDNWSYGAGKNERTFSLRIDGAVPGPVSSSDPIRFLSDYSGSLSTIFAMPPPAIGPTGVVTWMTNASICLELDRAVTDQDPTAGVAIIKGARWVGGSFYTPYVPEGGIIIKTITLLEWIQGSVNGFTSQPISTHDYYALTFRPEHHNFNNNFIVDPSLEPSLTATQRAELVSQNIKLFYGYTDEYFSSGDRLFVLGFDGTVREVQ